MKKHFLKMKRPAALAAGLFMLIAVLFSALYLASEADHDCAGEDCPICSVMHQCENTLHRISDGTAAPAAAPLPAVIFLFSALFISINHIDETLVSEKVRLNN